MDDDKTEYRASLRKASRWLHGHGYEPAHEELARVADWCRTNEVEADVYGEGAGLQAFETRVATMLGMEAARFVPSGSLAQPIALRIWCDRERLPHFGMHPTCHLELHEQRGYRRLHGLDARLIGPSGRPMLAEDLDPVKEPLAALVVELPTRENGGQLPAWDDLVALTERARERGIHPHLDGARLWEAQVAYGRPFAEICALFDSVYVSFYKGIGALPGAMLLGPADFVAEAVVWQRRQGGNLFTLLPNWASAAMRLDACLQRLPAYRDKALRVSDTLREVPGLHLLPDPPQVNLFHLLFEAESETLLDARDQVAEECGLWLFGGVQPSELQGWSRTEIYIGEGALEIADEELARAAGELMERARARGRLDHKGQRDSGSRGET